MTYIIRGQHVICKIKLPV